MLIVLLYNVVCVWVSIGDRLEPCKLRNAEIIQNELASVNAVEGDGSPEKSDGNHLQLCSV